LPDEGEVYRLNPQLVEWAYQLTKGIRLDDNDAMRERRAQYAEAAARRAPAVIRGDTLSAGTYWHGRLMNEWANRWVRYYTEGHGNYVTTAMEDSGTLQALTWLARARKVDQNRALVLRTASNFDSQRPGITAAESLAETKIGNYTAYLPSLEAAYRVGSAVVRELVKGWKEYGARTPALVP
jgi:purine nucleoside permease